MAEKTSENIFVNANEIFRTKTRGGQNEYARFFCAVVFPQYAETHEAVIAEQEKMRSLFDIPSLGNDIAGGWNITLGFNTRGDFAKFPAIFRYVHARGGHLVAANWDRDFGFSYNEKHAKDCGYAPCEPSNAPDSHPVFWATLAAAQMFFKE
jgi:hypothetical protein